MSAAQIFTDWPGLGPEQQLTEVRRLIESMQEEEAREARVLARANVAALEDWQEWLEQRQEDQREMMPEFLASIERGEADLADRRNGIRLFPVRAGAGTVTPEIVRELLEEGV